MKIFNWIVGSFCRTLGRFLFYIAVGLIAMLFISGKVHALSNDFYGTDVQIADLGAIWENTSATSYTKIDYEISGDESKWYATSGQPFKMATYGGRVSQCGLSFIENSYYSVTYYFTGTSVALHPFYSSVSNILSLSSGLNPDYDLFTNFNYTDISQNVQMKCDIPNYYSPVGECVESFTVIFKAPVNATCVTIAFSSADKNTYYNSEKLFVGYSYQNLGQKALTESDIQNALSSQFDNVVNSINLSIESMKDVQEQTNDKLDEQIQQDKEQHDETMNTITSEEMPDLDFNVVGWLPQGSIDSLINLPLTLLNSMNNKVGASCSPYQLPYIGGSTISIPCIGNYLSNLSGWGYLIDTLDIFMGVILIYKLLMSLYKDVQKILSLKENDDELGGIE